MTRGRFLIPKCSDRISVLGGTTEEGGCGSEGFGKSEMSPFLISKCSDRISVLGGTTEEGGCGSEGFGKSEMSPFLISPFLILADSLSAGLARSEEHTSE